MQSCQGLPRLLALTSLTGALSCYQHHSFIMMKSTPRKPSTELFFSLLRLSHPFLVTAVDSAFTLHLKSGNMAGEENGLHESIWKFCCPAIKRQIREGGHLGKTWQYHPMTEDELSPRRWKELQIKAWALFPRIVLPRKPVSSLKDLGEFPSVLVLQFFSFLAFPLPYFIEK